MSYYILTLSKVKEIFRHDTHVRQILLNYRVVSSLTMLGHFDYLKEVIVKALEFHRKEIRNLETNKEKFAANGGANDFCYVSELREERVRIKGIPRIIRRVFVTTHDILTAAYEGVGWVLADDMDVCMVCNRQFSMFFDPQLHCHACGSVVCTNCQHPAIVQEIKRLGPVPVCQYCDWGQVSFR